MPTSPQPRPLPSSHAAVEMARGLAAGALFATACLAWFTPTLENAGWALVQAVLSIGR